MEKGYLQKFGLTEGESKVYLTLLKTGSSTTGKITQNSGVSNSKVYEILERLYKKGLIGKVSIKKTKYFEAKNPERLYDLVKSKEEDLKEKKKKLKSSLPKLKEIYKNSESGQEAEIVEGISGIKSFTETIIYNEKKGNNMYILGAQKESNEILGSYFKEWHTRRIKKGIHAKILYNHDAKEYAKERKKMSCTEVKILPKHIETPALVDITNDKVATILFGERPLCIVIRNPDIAKSYRNYFELLWESSRTI